MKKISLLIIFFSLKLNSQNFNQTQIDSIVAVTQTSTDDTLKCSLYNRISNFYLYVNINKGLLYADKEIRLATHLNWTKGIGIGHLDKGKNLISKGDFTNAQNNLMQAEAIFIKTHDSFNLANTYNQLGILKANQNKFPEALDFFYTSIKGFEFIKNNSAKLNIAYSYQNIANIYTATENYEKALENYDASIKLFEEIPNEKLAIAMNVASKGLIYQKQNNHVAALKAFKNAEKMVLPLNSEINLAFINSWIGSAYLFLNDYDLSLQYSNKALKQLQVIGDEILITSTIQNIGYAYLKKGIASNNLTDVETGFQNIKKTLATNKRIGNIELLINDYRYLSEYYDYKKEYKNSLEAYKSYALYNDSIYNSKNKQSIQNLQDERTIELRDKEILVNKITLETKEKQKWYFIVALFLLFVIVSLLLIQSRIRKKINIKLNALNAELDQSNKIKARFFSIINHDLRSPVSNLIHFLHLKNENPDLLDAQTKNRLEQKTISSAENLLVAMEDILLWSKGQMENFKPLPKNIVINELFSELHSEFSSYESITFTFINLEGLQLVTDVNYLKTIIRNLTGNAIKVLATTSNATIIWKATSQNNNIVLSITDNGTGAKAEQFIALYNDDEVVGIKTGLGLHLIKDLAKAIDCKITVDTIENIGTTVLLIFHKH